MVYGPQENDKTKSDFYENISVEIERCLVSGDSLLLTGDFNAKLGVDIIQNDIHSMTKNGKSLYAIMQKYNLYLLNSSELCSGVFTRARQVNGKQEMSVLDYVFVSFDIFKLRVLVYGVSKYFPR